MKMTLIDKEKFIEEVRKRKYSAASIKLIEEQPEVKAIPIDKPFLKMRYDDYVVYNKKWLVNHLQTEWNILQGKEYQPAIPKEWIERKLAEHWYVDYDIRELLEDWEKENETNRC